MKLSAFAIVLAGGVFPLLYAGANNAPPVIYTIQTVAGSSHVGDGGPALQAAIGDAEGVAIDSAGNILIADAYDHRVRKISPDGNISTVAGDGSPGFRGDGGPAASSRLNNPYGIAFDRVGNLYIADLGNNRVRKVSPNGTISTVAGTDSLMAPRNVAVDSAGTLYISEFNGHRVRHVRTDGVVEIVAGTGVPGLGGDGGPATAAQLSSPAGLAFDSAGNLYIADSGNGRIRKVAGGVMTTVLGPDAAGNSPLYLPTAVVVDAAGDLFIADYGNDRIQLVTALGSVSTVPGAGRDLALDPAGNLLIASWSHLLELTPALALQTIAGDGSYWFRGDGGDAASARLWGPVAVALDSGGALHIADRNNCRVRDVSPTGTISTQAGDGSSGPAVSQLSYPSGVAVDAAGNVDVADQDNDRIQQVTATGTILTLAGTETPGFNGDGLPATATEVFSPSALAVAADRTLYFADSGNQRVRKIAPNGVVSTVIQTAAAGLALDASGNVYVSDSTLHSVERIDPQGQVTVLAGTGAPGLGGDGGPAAAAQLNSPSGLAVDAPGNIYIADTGNSRIRMIGIDGVIRTIAGNGAADFDGDGGPALSAALNTPMGLAVDAGGDVFIADFGNNRIRQLTPAPIAVEQTRPLAVVSAASMLAGPIAPGEIVSVFGLGIGPVTPQGGTLDALGLVATEIGETQVQFDGIAAPLYYVQDSQINAQAPYEIAGKSTVDIEVFYQGRSRGKATVAVAAAAPGIFTVSAGTGLAVALNRDGSLNSPIEPAPRGSIVTLYATGEGIADPSATDGKPAAEPLPKPTLPVTLTVGGYPAQILFAGAAPGFAGLLQINARLPGPPAPTGNLAVVLRIGAASSQSGVTLAVR
ncbi:MAG TPA: hypothetical protein VMT32_20010 [Bryobacteraceae bacterium]|nr:hypothetical protein [Bryobacteraceae bacterium]